MGKKKDKLYKLEPETKAMIAAVRSAVEDCAATGLYGRFMGFEESHTADDYRLTAVFDCGEYRLRLRYLPSVHRISEPENRSAPCGHCTIPSGLPSVSV